jgi:hypothetical protein
MDDGRNDNPPSSPWRQPVVWLVVALVAASVAAGVAMVFIAGNAGNNDAVPDQVQRTAGAQVADIDADELARRRQLSAIVRVDAKRGTVQVLPVSGDFDRTRPLRISLHHPMRAAEDQVLDLAVSGPGWQGAARIDGSHDWNLQLEPARGTPEDNRWRLRGRLPKGQLAARVAPSLQEP